MTGRAETGISTETLVPGDVALEDTGERPDAIRLRAKEVLGLAGLLGSGADRVLRRLFGLKPRAATCASKPEWCALPARPTRSAPASAWCRASAGSA